MPAAKWARRARTRGGAVTMSDRKTNLILPLKELLSTYFAAVRSSAIHSSLRGTERAARLDRGSFGLAKALSRRGRGDPGVD